jgi:esterase/lipase superfamily enzyme
MPDYWMISNRALENGLPGSQQGPVSFYIANSGSDLKNFSSWHKIAFADFKALLVAAADAFPQRSHADNENQSHVTLLVHGYNVNWIGAADMYQKLCASLYSGPDSLGICISFDWPSYGSVVDYYPDRGHAVACSSDLADLLCELYDWLLEKQQAVLDNPANGCKAKVSLIAHSMGNYLLQKAMSAAWQRKNKPLLASLLNQLLMVAADVDNDLFQPGADDYTDGNALANLSYRITALYSGRDAVLGASAGLKHFGTRRLGRSGLTVRPPTGADNIWDIDCSSFFPSDVKPWLIHGAYFYHDNALALMRQILRGIDRGVLDSTDALESHKWP